MLNIVNAGIREILASHKTIILYGASQNINLFFNEVKNEEILARTQCIVDRNEKLDGTMFRVNNRKLPIVSLRKFLQRKRIKNDCQIIIMIEDYEKAVFYLDQIDEMDGIRSYIWKEPFLRIHSGKTVGKKIILPKPEKGKYIIPQVIHYCWFGGKELPDNVKDSIESWKCSNPEFQLQCWNESNYDISCIPYIKEAYDKEKYSFVSDFVRYDVVYRYGGFYFDTDVELYASIEDLRYYRGFFSVEYYDLVASGLGFAAEAGDEMIGQLRDNYLKRHFILEDGTLNLTPCSRYETDFFGKKGFAVKNQFQVFEDFLVFPYEVFSPMNQYTAMLEITQNTRGIHRFDCSWFGSNQIQEWVRQKQSRQGANDKIKQSWLKEHYEKV